MDNQLLTLSKIFSERLFRIPDYQRGYAWTEKQLHEFWNDIDQLDVSRNHYTGVLTLENVPKNILSTWDDDLWICESKSYSPYFVVDGQQRLTTSILLIQAILERVGDKQMLNFTSKSDIQRKFIFDSKDEGISRSYIFGYEKDNPSYEFLKTQIFGERSSSNNYEQTAYTQNLARAKAFFCGRVSILTSAELELLYRKLTQNLLFNIFTITDDIDVCVAFETMNNRGKPLSYLELLKNRLIYLSLKFPEDDFEKRKLRASINDCWKSIYHNLGRNRDNPLDDDLFLQTHYWVYFGNGLVEHETSRNTPKYWRSLNYADDLLERRFVGKQVSNSNTGTESVTLASTYKYVSSLQEAVETWYCMWNPMDSGYDFDTQVWLDKMIRLNLQVCAPLVLVFLQEVSDAKKRVQFLQALERHLFVLSLVTRTGYVSVANPIEMFYELAVDLHGSGSNAEKVIKNVTDKTNSLVKDTDFMGFVFLNFRRGGFYSWPLIRYFLFEYNLELQRKTKTDRPKIFWPEFHEDPSDFVTVEHIYPKNAKHKYWTTRFKNLSQKRREALLNSLGNLLPLSKPKNSSLSNKPFPEKVSGDGDSVIGFRFGCYAENEVASSSEWSPKEIVSRGIKMLSFMERRWSLELGDDTKKKELLGVEFVK